MRLLLFMSCVLLVAAESEMDRVVGAINTMAKNPNAAERFYQTMMELSQKSCGVSGSNLCKLQAGLASSTWFTEMQAAHQVKKK